jgi:predicted 3-demethylubiquinone-9 3-methyltransferase (glyoxalase superfamily)
MYNKNKLDDKMEKIITFLMFQGGQAEEAMNFYVSIFENSNFEIIKRHGTENPMEIPGTVQQAIFTLNGQTFMCMDSNAGHQFTFTPSISFFVNCKTENEVETLFNKLSENGMVLMELAEYPFSKKFGWVQDKFGVSWQLYLMKIEVL